MSTEPNRYISYELSRASKAQLAALVGGRGAFPRHVGDHITYRFGVYSAEGVPMAKKIEVYGFASDGRGVEAFLVKVDDKARRPDKSYYHITWSNDPNAEIHPAYYAYEPAGAQGLMYANRHSNAMLRALFDDKAAGINYTVFPQPVVIEAKPYFVEEDANGRKNYTALTIS